MAVPIPSPAQSPQQEHSALQTAAEQPSRDGGAEFCHQEGVTARKEQGILLALLSVRAQGFVSQGSRLLRRALRTIELLGAPVCLAGWNPS